MANVGKRLREARERIPGMTQTKLSIKSGVKQSTISEIENGQISDPSGSAMYRLSRALGVRMVWFYNPKENMAWPPGIADDPDVRAQLSQLAEYWAACSPRARKAILEVAAESADRTDGGLHSSRTDGDGEALRPK